MCFIISFCHWHSVLVFCPQLTPGLWERTAPGPALTPWCWREVPSPLEALWMGEWGMEWFHLFSNTPKTHSSPHFWTWFSIWNRLWLFFFIIFNFYLLMVALGLCCYKQASSSGVRWGYSLVAVHRLLTVVASLWSTGFQASGLQRLWLTGLLCGMWDLPRPRTEPVSPALAGRLLITGSVLLPGKSHGWRSLVGHSPWCLESDTTERLHFHFHQGSPDLNFSCSILQPDFSWPLAPSQTVWFSGPGSQPVFSSGPTYTLALVLVCILVVCMLLSNLLNLCVTAFPIVTWGFYNSILEIQYLRAVLT